LLQILIKMPNPFKEIKQEEVPSELKGKVMTSVNTAKFFLDLAELFSVNYFGSISNLFKSKGSSNKGPEDPGKNAE